MTLEQELEDIRNHEKVLTAIWVGFTAMAGVLAVAAYMYKNWNFLGLLYGLWTVVSLAYFAFQHVYGERREEIEEELRELKLERRIEELEEEVL